MSVALRINGRSHEVVVDARTTLLDLLREHLDLTGAKKGCNFGARVAPLKGGLAPWQERRSKEMMAGELNVLEREVRANLMYRNFTRVGSGNPLPDRFGYGVRVLTRTMKKIAEIAGAGGTESRDRSRSVQLRVLEIARAVRAKGEQSQQAQDLALRARLAAEDACPSLLRHLLDERNHGLELCAQALQRHLIQDGPGPLHAGGDLLGEPLCLSDYPARCLGDWDSSSHSSVVYDPGAFR